ncbi:uncharacterized protein LOC121047193 [Ixodes scapularis]|uniref:uncharacterized protein LOC121047193 n=1 Tax=Ixodes scapularis TaxID=6945 RepID=UPI001AD771CC|nr:uncharacterized protein LOC121047193 [Ixodes scapularis]
MTPRRKTMTTSQSQMEKAKKRGKRDKASVECEGCEKWVDISETPFESCTEAENSTYKCKECKENEVRRITLEEEIERQVNALREAMRVKLEEAKTERAAIESRMLAKLEEERTLRIATEEKLNAIMQEERNKREKLGEVFNEWMKSCEPEQMTVNGAENAPQQLEPRNGVKEKMTYHTDGKETVSFSQERTGSGDLDKEQGRQTTGGQTERSQHRNYKEALMRQRADPDDGTKKQDKEKKVDKRVLVVGDTNAFKIKRATLKVVDYDKKVHFATKPGAQLRESLERAERDGKIWNAEAGVVVIHAGVTDVQGEESVEEMAAELGKRLEDWTTRAPKHSFMVYEVPEIKDKGDPLKERCAKWNRLSREISQQLGPRVEVVKNTGTGNDMEDGCYNRDAAIEEGQALGNRLKSFLGLKCKGKSVTPMKRRQERMEGRLTLDQRLQRLEEQLQRMCPPQGHAH